MASKLGDEMVQIEAIVKHKHTKSWLIEDQMTGKEVWLPFSVGNMLDEPNPDGLVIFECQEWWCKKNGLI